MILNVIKGSLTGCGLHGYRVLEELEVVSSYKNLTGNEVPHPYIMDNGYRQTPTKSLEKKILRPCNEYCIHTCSYFPH